MSVASLYQATEVEEENKLSNAMTFFTLMKGFVGTAVLYLPREIYLGGWGTTIICLGLSMVLSFYCALLLLESQKQSRARSFSEIGKAAYGKFGKNLVGIFLILTQVGFCIAMFYFLISQTQEAFHALFHVKLEQNLIALFYFVLLSVLSWIKDQTKFSQFHLLADIVIVTTVATVIAFSIQNVEENGWGKDTPPVTNTWMVMLGYSIFVYEGIGIIIPVQSVCKDVKAYPKIVFGVIFSLFVIYCSYGIFCVKSYGDKLDSPLVLDQFPENNAFGSIIKIIYCLTLVVTIPLMMFPAHQVIEDFLYSKKRLSDVQRDNYQRINRTLTNGIAVISAVLLGQKVDLFLSILGSFACIPVAFTLPALFHFRICARTKIQTRIDLAIVVISIILMIISTCLTLFTSD